MRNISKSKMKKGLAQITMLSWFCFQPMLASAQTITCAERNGSIEDPITCQTVYDANSLGGDNTLHDLVLEDPQGQVIPGNTVGAQYVGMRLKYILNFTGTTNNACWSYLNIEDKLPPEIECPEDVDVWCFQSTEPSEPAIGMATATACSEDPVINYSDRVITLTCNDNALDFDGVDDYVIHSSVLTTQTDDLAIELWANWDGLGTPTQRIVYNGNSSNSGYGLFIHNGDLVLLLGGITLPVISPMPVNAWTHIALVREAGVWSCYINGTDSGFSNATNPNVPTDEFTIGGGGIGAPPEFFSGRVDEFRFWNYPLSESEINEGLDQELDGNEAGLIAYYSFNEGVAGANNTGINSLPDLSGNGNDATLNNFTLNGGSSNWVINRYDASKYAAIICRTWTAIGANGKTASCEQKIRVERACLSDITFPEHYDESCLTAGENSTDPKNTGFPQYDPDGVGGFDPIDIVPGVNNGFCMLSSFYEDLEIPKCGANKLIKRTWMILNMCEKGEPNVMTAEPYIQLITITQDPPVFVELDDVTIDADFGVLDGPHGTCRSTESLPLAEVEDLCTDQSIDEIVIIVPGFGEIDNGGDIPDPGLPLGTTTVTYQATDNCGNVVRMDVEVTVVDNTAPQCQTQNANITLSEDDGIAQASVATFNQGSNDNCSATVFVKIRRLISLCDSTDEDDFGETVEFCCADVPSGTQDDVMIEQLVCDLDPDLDINYVSGVVNKNSDGSPVASDFKGNCSRCMAVATVKLPTTMELICPIDVSLSCDEYDPDTLYGEPTFTNVCSSVIFVFDYIDTPDLSCTGGTVTRTHRLLGDGDEVIATCDQILTVGGGNLEITPPADYIGDCGLLDENVTLAELPDTSITGGAPVVSNAVCESELITFQYVDSDLMYVDGVITFTRTWTEQDDPNNCLVDYLHEQLITLPNCCLPPIQSILSELGGTVTLTLNKPAAGYTIVWYDQGEAQGSPLPNAQNPTIAVSANSLQVTGVPDLKEISVQLTQINNTSCVFVENTDGINLRIINGFVSTEFGTPIQNVRVALESNQAARVVGKDEIMSEVMTDHQGIFEFDDADIPSLNKLTLAKDGDDRDNVSTRDILIMARHILGIKEITSPYTYVAADLSGNGSISTGDMLLMQKMVLGIMDDLPNNTSWRFVKEDHVFDDMNTILDYNFPEYFTFTGEETEKELKELNFIAIKIGDLAGAYGAELQGGNSTPKVLSLQTDNQRLLPGAIIEVPIRAGDTRNLSGYQHAYKFDTDKILFTGLEVGSELELGGNNFGYQHLGDGYLTTNWFDTEDKNIEAGTVIYTLKFEVREASQLKDVLSISSEHTQAEAYFDEDKVGSIQFNFSELVGDQLIVVSSPNPFKESVQIRFDAPNSGDAVIRVSDISGREVYRSEIAAVKGENQLTINKSDLQNAGIYILKVDLNGSSATQKIIMME